jgi:hypothetical protein
MPSETNPSATKNAALFLQTLFIILQIAKPNVFLLDLFQADDVYLEGTKKQSWLAL